MHAISACFPYDLGEFLIRSRRISHLVRVGIERIVALIMYRLTRHREQQVLQVRLVGLELLHS